MGSCIYVCTREVWAGGFNKAKSISKQCVCIIRYLAVLTSRSHITEKYVVLSHSDLHCAFASLQAMPSEFEYMTWYMLREKYPNPQRPHKQEMETSIIDVE